MTSGEDLGYPQGTGIEIIRAEKPPFGDLFEQGLLAMCNHYENWAPGVAKDEFEIEPIFGNLTYKGRAVARPSDTTSPLYTEVGGAVVYEIADVVPTLPDGTELSADSFLEVPLWYEEAAEFLRSRGWHEGPEPFILEGDQVSVWFPPEHHCAVCPQVLACKTKKIT